MGKLFMVGAFPPPTGGQSAINQRIYEIVVKARRNVYRVDLSAGSLVRGPKYHLTRLYRVFKGLLFVTLNGSKGDILYISVDSGFGLFYNAIFCFLGRALQMKQVLHYHSFTFADKKSLIYALMRNISGKDACEVFLCSCMRKKIYSMYGELVNYIIAPNAFHYINASAEHEVKKNTNTNNYSESVVTIGLMSHLSNQKGLDIFLDVVRAARDQNIKFRAVLAGPAVTNEDECEIRRALFEIGVSLSYLGSVSGNAKKSFFDQVDIFVFPTRFKVEAQPLVLLEAMAAGCAIVTSDRGCIGEDWGNSNRVHIVSDFKNFVPQVLKFMAEYQILDANQRVLGRMESQSVALEISKGSIFGNKQLIDFLVS